MRICHIVEAASGGSGQVVLDLVKSSVDAGNDVTLIHSPDRTDDNFCAGIAAMKDGVQVYALPMKARVGLHDIPAAWNLYRLLRQVGPFDVIHSHSGKAGGLARLAGLFLPRAVQVYTPHAFKTMAPDASPLYGWAEWLLSWFGSAIICVSSQEKQHASEKLGIPRRKLHVIVNGVPLNHPATRNEAREQMGFLEDDFVVGFVGRLIPQKNPHRLITVFARAAKLRSDLRLAIVGDGPLRAEVEQAVDYYGLKERVHFLGHLTGRDFMPGFDCLICTSDYESFGLVLLEAMAAGVPPITTPVGIAEEAIVSGMTGYVSPDFSIESLASAIVRLASFSPATRAEMAEEAREQATHFSLEGMASKTMDLYADLVTRRRA